MRTHGSLVQSPRAEGEHDEPAYRVTLLGGFRTVTEGVELALPPAARRLIALLALRGAPLPRQEGVSLLWPHLDERAGGASLRTTISRLRRLAPSLIAPGRHDLFLRKSVDVDVGRLESMKRAVANGEWSTDAETWNSLDLTAELLPGWSDDWLSLERHRVRELCLRLIEARASRLAADGDSLMAATTAYDAVCADPLRETAVRTLIEIQLADGNRVEAVRSFLEFRQRLRREVGLEPSESLRRLMAVLLAPRPELKSVGRTDKDVP